MSGVHTWDPTQLAALDAEGTQALIAFQAQLVQFVRSLDPQRTVFVRQGGNLGFQMLDAFRQRKLSWTRWALTSHGITRILNADYTLTPAAVQIQQDLQKPCLGTNLIRP